MILNKVYFELYLTITTSELGMPELVNSFVKPSNTPQRYCCCFRNPATGCVRLVRMWTQYVWGVYFHVFPHRPGGLWNYRDQTKTISFVWYIWVHIPPCTLTWPWNMPIFSGRYHQNGGFSMAMFVYRSVIKRTVIIIKTIITIMIIITMWPWKVCDCCVFLCGLTLKCLFRKTVLWKSFWPSLPLESHPVYAMSHVVLGLLD